MQLDLFDKTLNLWMELDPNNLPEDLTQRLYGFASALLSQNSVLIRQVKSLSQAVEALNDRDED